MRKNSIIKQCEICKKEFSVPKYRIKTAKFCSLKCCGFRKGFIPWNKGVTGYTTSRKGKKTGWSYWTGKRRSPETIEKIVKSRLGKCTGENNWNWIKDRTKLCRISKQGERRTSIYFYWRKSVWERDNWKCKINNKDCSGRLEAHHILGWVDHPELRYDINNGITLCHAHHPRKRAEEKRLSPYFQEIVSESKV